MSDAPASPRSELPAEVLALQALLVAERAARIAAQAEAKARALLIDKLRLTIAKLKHERFGVSAERTRLLVEQLELELSELGEDRAAAEAKVEIAEQAVPATIVKSFKRRKPARRKLPEHLPRERVVHPGPTACACCGGGNLRKLGEDVSETLECVPARWKVIEHVREKFTCRNCETISQTPAPSHPIARGRAGPQLLAQVLFGKYGAHLPLNRQSTIYAREGVDLDVSTLADWVGQCAAALDPVIAALRAHVFAAARIHGDDTPVPVLAKGQTKTGRLWVYVRDDRPFGGADPAAACFFYSPDRGGAHPQRHLEHYAGFLQADAYAGFERLYQLGRKPGPITEVACWAHARRKFFDLARLQKAPIAIEAVKRIDALFEIERTVNGQPSAERRRVRQAQSRPLIVELEAWFAEQRAKLSAKADLAKAIAYALNRWSALTRFLDDGRLCLSNNAAERALRGIAVGRHNWTFAGSDTGGERAAAIYTLIESAKLNDIDPRAWLADVLARLPDHPAKRVAELLPWHWRTVATAVAA